MSSSSYELPSIPNRDRSRSPINIRQGGVTSESDNERQGPSRHRPGRGRDNDSERQVETQEIDNSQQLSQREKERER